MPYYIAPAGSNVAYINLILEETENLAETTVYHNIEQNESWTHDLNFSNITEHCIKIYFEKYFEAIILNWHYKHRILHGPQKKNWEYVVDWERSQKEHWKMYEDKWESRAVAHWYYKIYHDQSYRNMIPLPGKNFNGDSLYLSLIHI